MRRATDRRPSVDALGRSDRTGNQPGEPHRAPPPATHREPCRSSLHPSHSGPRTRRPQQSATRPAEPTFAGALAGSSRWSTGGGRAPTGPCMFTFILPPFLGRAGRAGRGRNRGSLRGGLRRGTSRRDRRWGQDAGARQNKARGRSRSPGQTMKFRACRGCLAPGAWRAWALQARVRVRRRTADRGSCRQTRASTRRGFSLGRAAPRAWLPAPASEPAQRSRRILGELLPLSLLYHSLPVCSQHTASNSIIRKSPCSSLAPLLAAIPAPVEKRDLHSSMRAARAARSADSHSQQRLTRRTPVPSSLRHTLDSFSSQHQLLLTTDIDW